MVPAVKTVGFPVNPYIFKLQIHINIIKRIISGIFFKHIMSLIIIIIR